MADKLETTLRGPEAYGLARRVIEAMEAAGVWPTPMNFEIWVHYLGTPESPLGREINRILAASEPFTEATAELLAAEYLPRGRLSEEIRDAGQVLDRELSSVTDAISKAHRSQATFGQTLDKAATSIETASGDAGLQAIVSGPGHQFFSHLLLRLPG
jgi:diguanylate cyclase